MLFNGNMSTVPSASTNRYWFLSTCSIRAGNHLIVTHLLRKIKRKFGSIRKMYCQCTFLCHRVLPVYSSYLTNSSIPHYRHQPRAVCARALPTLTYRVEKQVGSTSEGTGKADTPIFDFGR